MVLSFKPFVAIRARTNISLRVLFAQRATPIEVSYRPAHELSIYSALVYDASYHRFRHSYYLNVMRIPLGPLGIPIPPIHLSSTPQIPPELLTRSIAREMYLPSSDKM